MSSVSVRSHADTHSAAFRGNFSPDVSAGLQQLLADDPSLTLNDVLNAALTAFLKRDDGAVRVTLAGPRRVRRWWKRFGKEVA